MAGGVNTIASLQGKVSSANALVVTLDGGVANATLVTITNAGIGVTSTDALVLTNTTNAAVGAQQMSGRIHFNGSGWKTDATAAAQDVDVLNELLPVQGTSAPTANLLWKYSVNGGAYSEIAKLTSTGQLTLPSQVAGTPQLNDGTNNGWGFGVESGTGPALYTSGAVKWAANGSGWSGIAGQYLSLGGAGAVTSATKLIKKVTAIADAVATAAVTVTVPNANHAATIKLTLLSSNGSTTAFQSSRTAEGSVVIARTAGVATVAVASTLTLTAIATVAAGATHTLAYGVTAMSGAAGATQTFDITVTIDDSGNLGSNQVVVLAEVINSNAAGVTIA